MIRNPVLLVLAVAISRDKFWRRGEGQLSYFNL